MYYQITAPVAAFSFACWLYKSQKNLEMNNSGFATYIVLYSTILIAGVVSSVLSFRGLIQNGTPSVIRTLIIKRHLSQIIIFIVCNSYICLDCAL